MNEEYNGEIILDGNNGGEITVGDLDNGGLILDLDLSGLNSDPIGPPLQHLGNLTLPYPNHCLLGCSSILLSDYSYKPISQVTSDDSIVCPFSKQPKKIKRCQCNIVDLKNLDTNNFPYRIPKCFFTPTIPTKDVYISGFHRIITPSLTNVFDWIQTHRLVPDEHKMISEEEILKITGENEIKYYHIELEEGKGGMFVDGLPVETLDTK